jgi:hypothetical protein
VNEIRLHVTRELIDALDNSVEERIAFEEPEYATTRQLRDMLAHFVTGEDGKPLTSAKARKLLNRLSCEQMYEAAKSLYQKLEEMSVNPQIAAS